MKCFCEISMRKGICPTCRKCSHPFKLVASCFDSIGPARSLVKAYLLGSHIHLAKEIASLIYLQMHRLEFPDFDCITTLPISFKSPLDPIGKELAKLCGIKCLPLLRRKWVPLVDFRLKKLCAIINQRVLLLDMLLDEPTQLRNGGWALQEGNPEILYGMTLCAKS